MSFNNLSENEKEAKVTMRAFIGCRMWTNFDDFFISRKISGPTLYRIESDAGKYMRTRRCPGSNKRCGYEMLQKSRAKSGKI